MKLNNDLHKDVCNILFFSTIASEKNTVYARFLVVGSARWQTRLEEMILPIEAHNREKHFGKFVHTRVGVATIITVLYKF